MTSSPPTAPSLRAILFDLDGTLVDSLQGIAATVDAVLEQRSLPPPDRTQLRSLVGAPLESIFGTLISDLDTVGRAALADAYRTLYWTTGVPHTPLFPGIPALLAECVRAGFLLALVTTKREDIATHLVDARGLNTHFSAVIGGDSTPHHKPHPEPALYALRRLGVEPAHATMVGDTTFDMEMARSAGCRAIGVTWGYGTPESLRASGAHDLAHDVGHLRTLLLGDSSGSR